MDAATLQAIVTKAGIMNAEEFNASFAVWCEDVRECREDTLSPAVLTGAPGTITAALQWNWDCDQADTFAAWCMAVVQTRFGITWHVSSEEPQGENGPLYVRLERDGMVERCDWQYLHRHRWAGAFCTIAQRLLHPVGVTVLDLETGWFDVVICFCWQTMADDLLTWFSEAE